jgi:hypothetical protein
MRVCRDTCASDSYSRLCFGDFLKIEKNRSGEAHTAVCAYVSHDDSPRFEEEEKYKWTL